MHISSAIPAGSQPTKSELVENDSFAEFPMNSTSESPETPPNLTFDSPMSEQGTLSNPLCGLPAGIAGLSYV